MRVGVTSNELSFYPVPRGVQYFGPSCPACRSRRTKRVGDSAVRQCQVCMRSSLYGALIPEAK